MKKIRYFLPAAIWTIAMFVLTLMPSSDVPKMVFSRIPYFDKFVHVGLFAAFVLLWSLGFRRLGEKRQLVYLARMILIAIALGLTIELLQKELVTLHRSFEWWDWVADIIGAFLGAAIFREIFPQKKEKEK